MCLWIWNFSNKHIPCIINSFFDFTANYLKNIYGIKATQVLEPVLSVPVECWYDIALHSEYNENQDYILTYILDPTEEKRKAIQYYSSKAERSALV